MFMAMTEKQRTSTYKNRKGETIFFRNWIIDAKPKSIIVIVHGLNSHSGYYHDFALQLNENGYEVYALDLPGRGRSEGERFYISDYEDIVTIIDQLIEIARTAHPSTPVILFGHSAGGVFAAVYTLFHQTKLHGLICESFAFRVPAPAFALTIIKLLGRIIPHAGTIRLSNKTFSRDPPFVEEMDHDPLIKNEKQPAKSMQQLLLASELLKERMPEITLPLFILHGTGDKATMYQGSEYFMEHAGSIDKQLKLYEGHYHDLLHDKYNGIIIRDIIGWLNERF